jgi:hypothetical protein
MKLRFNSASFQQSAVDCGTVRVTEDGLDENELAVGSTALGGVGLIALLILLTQV